MTGAAERFLDRLERVRQTGTNRWIARCPAHKDKSPSLSIRGLDDGRVLLHCFAGCGAAEVVDAVGLRLSDLFSHPLASHLPPVGGGFSARELLEVISHEATVAALLTSDAQGRALTAEELARLAQAAARLGKAQALSHGR